MNIENVLARRKKLLDEAYAELDALQIRPLHEYSESDQLLIKKIARAASASRIVSFGNAAHVHTKKVSK